VILAGGGFFSYFRNILAENLADFCARFRLVCGSWKSCNNPLNIVYCLQIHCFWMCKVVCASADCFSPRETLCLVRLQWSDRPTTGRCSRRVLECIESTYWENRRNGKS